MSGHRKGPAPERRAFPKSFSNDKPILRRQADVIQYRLTRRGGRR